MSKIFLFSILLTLIFSFVFIEKEEEKYEYKSWSSDKKLIWSDFKGKPDSLSEYEASTNAEIEYKLNQQTTNYINFEINNKFDCNLSWTKSKIDLNLLEHENLHFDISELVARKIRKKFSEYNLTEIKKSRIELDSIFYNFGENYMNELNEKYDIETNHGTILEKQIEWELSIAEELKKLQKYAPTQVIVKKARKKIVSKRKRKFKK